MESKILKDWRQYAFNLNSRSPFSLNVDFDDAFREFHVESRANLESTNFLRDTAEPRHLGAFSDSQHQMLSQLLKTLNSIFEQIQERRRYHKEALDILYIYEEQSPRSDSQEMNLALEGISRLLGTLIECARHAEEIQKLILWILEELILFMKVPPAATLMIYDCHFQVCSIL